MCQCSSVKSPWDLDLVSEPTAGLVVGTVSAGMVDLCTGVLVWSSDFRLLEVAACMVVVAAGSPPLPFEEELGTLVEAGCWCSFSS
jgi:hypothetical protein